MKLTPKSAAYVPVYHPDTGEELEWASFYIPGSHEHLPENWERGGVARDGGICLRTEVNRGDSMRGDYSGLSGDVGFSSNPRSSKGYARISVGVAHPMTFSSVQDAVSKLSEIERDLGVLRQRLVDLQAHISS